MKKRLISILLVLTMVFALGLTALAAPKETQATTAITVSPVGSNVVIHAYKIIEVTQMEGGYDKYSIVGTYRSTVISVLEALDVTVPVGASDSDLLLLLTNYTDRAALATALAAALEGIAVSADYTSDSANFNSTNKSITIPDVALGYYLLLDKTEYPADLSNVLNPMLVLANSTSLPGGVNVNLKTSTYTKPVKTADDTNYSIGDTVTYTATVEVPNYSAYTVAAFTITDTMGLGLKYNDDLAVTIGGAAIDLGDTASYGLTPTDSGFVLTINDIKNFSIGATIAMTYTATVTAAAPTDGSGLINDISSNQNNAELTGDTVTVYTYGINVSKIDEYENQLEGVKFNLYAENPDQNSNAVPLTFSGTPGSYLRDQGDTGDAELVTDEDGALSLWGLKAGTYWLVETETLDGYNLLAAPVEITITPNTEDPSKVSSDTDATDAYYDLTVVNYMGIKLPGTGGMGTALFTVIGAMIIVAAGAVLVIGRKRVFGK